MNMYEKAAENLDKAIKSELGENYTTEDLLRLQMDKKLITPKSAAEYNLRNEFAQIKDQQQSLPVEEQQSVRSIASELASKNNCSLSRVIVITKGV